jgi:hypothetical protein
MLKPLANVICTNDQILEFIGSALMSTSEWLLDERASSVVDTQNGSPTLYMKTQYLITSELVGAPPANKKRVLWYSRFVQQS